MRVDRSLLQKLFSGLVLLMVIVAPTQWSLRLPGGMHITLADLLLAGALPLGLLTGFRSWRLPFVHVLFLGLAALAVLGSSPKTEGIKEWIQLALYFGAGTLVAGKALRQSGRRGLQMGLYAFLGTGALIVALAVVQYWWGASDDPLVAQYGWRSADDPLTIRGTFGNRNVLGGYFALLLPIAFGIFLRATTWRMRLFSALLVLAGLSVCLSGPALLVIVLACIALAALRGPGWLIGTGAVLMVGYTLLLPQLPRDNEYETFASMALYDEAGEPTRRYPEWQAAAVMTLERPWTGHGLGGYQKRIGTFYGVVPNATGPSEPDIQNLYLVLAATAGIPACFAFLALLLQGAACGVRAALRFDLSSSIPGLDAGMAAAVAAFALTAVWHPLLVRGIGLPLALVLAAAHYSRERT